MSRNRLRRLRGGVVVQSGIGLQLRDRPNLMDPTKRPFRAVVVNSRVLGEDGHLRGHCVECDIILIRTQIGIQNVPVMQNQYGVNNVHDLWVPRPSTRVVGDDEAPLNLTRVLSRRGSYIGPATPLGDTDGDHVLVDFVEGNRDYPIIIGALPHERSNRQLRQGIGWREGDDSTRGELRRDELHTHHYGTELRINEQGDLLIDTVGAYKDISTEDPAPAVGQVRVRLKDNLKFTVECDGTDVLEVFKDGTGVHVHLGEGATESIIKGDAFKTLYDAHTHSSPAGGSTGIPATLMDIPAGTHLSTQHKVK